jgi:hypothetical protein
MEIVKTTFVEMLFSTLYNMDSNRPQYFVNVVDTAMEIFNYLEMEENILELQELIRTEIEIPLRADFTSVQDAFDNPKFAFSNKAFCKIGDPIDPIIVTKYEIKRRLMNIKRWVYSTCSEIARDVKFQAIQQLKM